MNPRSPGYEPGKMTNFSIPLRERVKYIKTLSANKCEIHLVSVSTNNLIITRKNNNVNNFLINLDDFRNTHY